MPCDLILSLEDTGGVPFDDEDGRDFENAAFRLEIHQTFEIPGCDHPVPLLMDVSNLRVRIGHRSTRTIHDLVALRSPQQTSPWPQAV
jgi:hypothetical protein